MSLSKGALEQTLEFRLQGYEKPVLVQREIPGVRSVDVFPFRPQKGSLQNVLVPRHAAHVRDADPFGILAAWEHHEFDYTEIRSDKSTGVDTLKERYQFRSQYFLDAYSLSL